MTFFFIDIDGTIADASKRYAEAGRPPSKEDKEAFRAWLKKVQNHESLLLDKPVPGMRVMLQALQYFSYAADDCQLFYLTAREEEFRTTTRSWLFMNGFPLAPLLMRGIDDWRSSGELKEAEIKNALSNFSNAEVVVIDDDPEGDIEEMCDKNGYTFKKALSRGHK